MPSYASNKGRARARTAREALGYERDGPLPDLIEAVEQRGGAHVAVLALPDGVAGAYIARPDCPLLFVNGNQAVTRQRFTLAHEFGHFRMGHSTVVDEQTNISGHTHDPNEVSANSFAAEFLVPRDAVQAWGARHVDGAVTLEHVVLLAHDFGVSPQAARYALEGATVAADAGRRKQLDDEIAGDLQIELGQRLGLEPLEDQLADAARRLPRLPAALTANALGDLLVGDLDIAGLAAATRRDPEEIEAMLTELGLDPLLPSSS